MTPTQRRILAAVLECGNDAYTLTVWQRLGGKFGSLKSIPLVAVYLALGEMEERGWVASQEGAATPERGMRPKRLWWITGEGKRQMEGEKE